MTFTDDFVTIHHGDAWALAPTLAPQSVHTIVTSPPYWGLRDYGEPGQFGLEPTPEEYVSRLVALFALLRPALRDDGTVWLNLGDSYARQAGDDSKKATDTGFGERGTGRTGKSDVLFKSGNNRPPTGLKPKDLVGIPWRVAFALQQPYEHVIIKDKTDRAWFAALIDGEGCITTSVTRPKTGINESYAVVLQIRMADRECLHRVVEITGMSHVQDEVLSPSMANGNQRPASVWKVAGENAATLLAEVYPYLLVKRRQAVAAWNLQRLKDGITTKRGVAIPRENMEMRRELHAVIRALNQREDAFIPDWCREPEYTITPGWYLRSDVIWHKPNPMPESVTDRPTKAHEYVFLLSKQARYYYDAEAIKEPMTDSSVKRYELAASRILEEEPDRYKERVGVASGAPRHADGMAFRPKAYKHEGAVRVGREAIANPNRVWTDAEALGTATRNRRSVWTIPTRPFSQAHFAVFPPDLIKPCILAGCPEGGTVLDPFMGSGTTAQVARSLGRKSIGFELNADYIAIAAEHRLAQGVLL